MPEVPCTSLRRGGLCGVAPASPAHAPPSASRPPAPWAAPTSQRALPRDDFVHEHCKQCGAAEASGLSMHRSKGAHATASCRPGGLHRAPLPGAHHPPPAPLPAPRAARTSERIQVDCGGARRAAQQDLGRRKIKGPYRRHVAEVCALLQPAEPHVCQLGSAAGGQEHVGALHGRRPAGQAAQVRTPACCRTQRRCRGSGRGAPASAAVQGALPRAHIKRRLWLHRLQGSRPGQAAWPPTLTSMCTTPCVMGGGGGWGDLNSAQSSESEEMCPQPPTTMHPSSWAARGAAPHGPWQHAALRAQSSRRGAASRARRARTML